MREARGARMYPIYHLYYLNVHGGIIIKETSEGTILAEAVSGAHRRAIDTHHASGFVVFDTGDQVMHREWWGRGA